jgi:hypothetical protein
MSTTLQEWEAAGMRNMGTEWWTLAPIRLLPRAGLLLALFLVLPSGAPVAAQETDLIAVMDLQAVGASEVEAVALTERLREVLLKTRRFTLVDRSQMAAVLDEQALQQKGCTEAECAVQVGRLLGVRKIVAGKAVKIDETTWLLSALMVDVETARTDRAESLRHQGNFFSLLDQRLPELGARLAGLQTVPAAVAPPAAVPETGKSKAFKVALFPSYLEGKRAPGLDKSHPKLVEALERMIEANAKLVTLEYSFYPTSNPEPYRRFRAHSQYKLVNSELWQGMFSKEPEDRLVYSAGRALKVGLVVLLRASWEGGTDNAFTVFLYDMKLLRRYEGSGSWTPGAWGRDVAGALKLLFQEARQGRREG